MSRLPGEPSGCSRVAPLQYRLLGALASTVALGRCPSRRFRDGGGVGAGEATRLGGLESRGKVGMGVRWCLADSSPGPLDSAAMDSSGHKVGPDSAR